MSAKSRTKRSRLSNVFESDSEGSDESLVVYPPDSPSSAFEDPLSRLHRKIPLDDMDDEQLKRRVAGALRACTDASYVHRYLETELLRRQSVERELMRKSSPRGAYRKLYIQYLEPQPLPIHKNPIETLFRRIHDSFARDHDDFWCMPIFYIVKQGRRNHQAVLRVWANTQMSPYPPLFVIRKGDHQITLSSGIVGRGKCDSIGSFALRGDQLSLLKNKMTDSQVRLFARWDAGVPEDTLGFIKTTADLPSELRALC